jgi:hypothetical protein
MARKQNYDRFKGAQTKTAGASGRSRLARSGNGLKGESQTPGARKLPVDGNGFKGKPQQPRRKAGRKFGPAG